MLSKEAKLAREKMPLSVLANRRAEASSRLQKLAGMKMPVEMIEQEQASIQDYDRRIATLTRSRSRARTAAP
jgi:hypothetical protein